MNKEYNKIGGKYAELIKDDALKRYLQYPGLLGLLGNVKGKRVLDIGCGNGFFSSMVAERGANLVGFDVSEKQIELAKENEKELGLGMEFLCSDQFKFKDEKKFDLVFSNMVIFYASNYQELVQFFKCAFKALKKTGEFVSVIVNPEYKRIGELRYDRRLIRTGEGKACSEFWKDGKVYVVSAEYSLFSKEQYETAAKEAGFKKLEWKKIKIESEGIADKGKEFWEGYDEDPLYGIIIAKK